MDNLAKLLAVIELLYDSVIDEEKWAEALQSLSDLVGGTGAFHIIANPQTGVIAHSESVGVDPIVNQKYLQYYAAKDVRIPPAIHYPVGQVVTEGLLLDKRAFERSELYGELLNPYDIPHFMAVWLNKMPHAFETIAIQGSASHGAFRQEAWEIFTRVIPHLLRAARLREMLLSARQSHRAYSQVLETLPFGVVFLDASGKVITATSAAERLFRAGDGLVQTRSRLRAMYPDDNQRLQRAIQIIIRARGSEIASEDSILIRRINNQRSLLVTVLPVLSPELLISTPQPMALLLIFDPERAPRPRAALIQKALHLTQAEGALANMLFEGISLREAAEALGKSANTCKAQLKSIYGKTGCRSHVDLAKAMMATALGTAG